MLLHLNIKLSITLFFCIIANAIGQTAYPKDNLKLNSETIIGRITKIDSLIYVTEASSKISDSTTVKTPEIINEAITKVVYNGSKNLNETQTNSFAGTESVVHIGTGSFENKLFINKLTNLVIKTQHISNMEYMYEVDNAKNANTERLEINIYYENEVPFYAVLIEDHFKNDGQILFSNKYNLQLTNYHKDTYFTNPFQKTIQQYILDFNNIIMKQK